MNKQERTRKTIEATMQIIAEKGMDRFSVIQSAERAGINEALIYRDFVSKENLLYSCYIDYVIRLGDVYNQIVFSNNMDIISKIELVWRAFFRFLLQNNYRTLFYEQFRSSSYAEKKKKKARLPLQNTHYMSFVNQIVAELKLDQNQIDILGILLMDGSLLFARRIIQGEMEDKKENIDRIWAMLSGGVKGMFA